MLYARLAELGGRLVERWPRSKQGSPHGPHRIEGVSFAPMLSKSCLPVDWSRAPGDHDQIRGLMAWPRASTDVLGGEA
ncbi:MAG: hypothetical protein ACLSUM_10675 [Dysosmobacter welbionis]